MGNIVLKVPNSLLKKMASYYKPYLKETPPQGAIFAAKTSTCMITGYHSGKIMFQGKGAEKEASVWKSKENVTPPSKALKVKNSAVNDHSYYPPNNVHNLILLGSDETGTGDYFGPMTVVCAHLSNEQMEKIDAWGVRDSKTIHDDTIRSLAPRLIRECTYSLLVLNNEKYNDMQKRGMNQGQMKALLHHQAIVNVMQTCDELGKKYEGVLIDQFVQPARYFEYLKSKHKMWDFKKNIYFATKAESLHPAVATASILARYSFLSEMEKLEKEVGFPLPKGAGPAVDNAAKEILKYKGKEALYKCTKWHFANTKKVIEQ